MVGRKHFWRVFFEKVTVSFMERDTIPCIV